MDISSVGGAVFSESVQTQYAVKCIQLERQSQSVMADLLLDTAEISQEAIDKCNAEKISN